MTLVADGKVIIEVGLNEMASKAENPHVPYGPEEVVPDAVGCARAGASIVHFHARNADGSQAETDDGLYRKAMEAIARECDVLTFPTSFQRSGDLWRADQLPHVWALVDDPPAGAPLRIGPYDGFRIGPRPLWDAAKCRLMQRTGAALTDAGQTPYALPEAMAEMLCRGLLPEIACYDVGEVRWVRLVALTGLLPQPVRLQLQLFDSYVFGPSATPASIDGLLAEWETDGPIDAEIEVVGYGLRDPARYERLLRHALDRGIHIRVGIGDCPSAFPEWRNAQLVDWAVDLCHAHGLAPASSNDVRARFGL